VKDGQASITAQRVAALRLTFDREPAQYGDANADEQLARDVAADIRTNDSPMSRYLAARTTFFDRVVVRALDGGMPQVVVAAAGYDGRALRYAKPGVRWYEIDHPDTQSDKQERLDRLGVDTSHITFVPVDFTTDDIAAAMANTTHDPKRPSLVLCEGVAVYLERSVLETLLRGLRSIAATRSRLAISLSVESTDPAAADRRAAFQAAVAAIGEPARTVLTADEATSFLTDTGWRATATAGQERARRAGLVTAERL
jgi:methyltransferase (TIGR00027 family)